MEIVAFPDAYQVMFLFLARLWERDQDRFEPGLPVLLGAMQLLGDGEPIDSALAEDWLAAVHKETADTVTSREAFDAMLRFLGAHRWGESDEIDRLLNLLTSVSSAVWEEWMRCMREIGDSK